MAEAEGAAVSPLFWFLIGAGSGLLVTWDPMTWLFWLIVGAVGGLLGAWVLVWLLQLE